MVNMDTGMSMVMDMDMDTVMGTVIVMGTIIKKTPLSRQKLNKKRQSFNILNPILIKKQKNFWVRNMVKNIRTRKISTSWKKYFNSHQIKEKIGSLINYLHFWKKLGFSKNGNPSITEIYAV